jgi:hypothetical protein
MVSGAKARVFKIIKSPLWKGVEGGCDEGRGCVKDIPIVRGLHPPQGLSLPQISSTPKPLDSKRSLFFIPLPDGASSLYLGQTALYVPSSLEHYFRGISKPHNDPHLYSPQLFK